MALLTLGPEFYRHNRNLYDKILRFVDGVEDHEINDIKVIYFKSRRFLDKEFCTVQIRMGVIDFEPHKVEGDYQVHLQKVRERIIQRSRSRSEIITYRYL